MLTTVIKQRLADIFIYGVRAEQPDGIGLLNFDDAKATQALHAEHMPRDFAKAPLLDGNQGVSPTISLADSIRNSI